MPEQQQQNISNHLSKLIAKGSDVTFQSAIYPSSQVLFGVLIELIFIFWAIFLESKRLLKFFWA